MMIFIHTFTHYGTFISETNYNLSKGCFVHIFFFLRESILVPAPLTTALFNLRYTMHRITCRFWIGRPGPTSQDAKPRVKPRINPPSTFVI
jgi:hypothetical protein